MIRAAIDKHPSKKRASALRMIIAYADWNGTILLSTSDMPVFVKAETDCQKENQGMLTSLG